MNQSKSIKLKHYDKVLFFASSFSFLLTLVINFIANSIPLNGLTTGEISDMYPNYFVPASFTFSIWGVIYSALFVYIFFRIRTLNQTITQRQIDFFVKIDGLFLISNVMNVLWLLSWHYLWMLASVLSMVGLFISLLLIAILMKKQSLPAFIPFRIYFGWITIALIANVTTLIVSDFQAFQWLWNGGEVSEQLLTFGVILIGIIIGSLTTWTFNDGWYGGVIIWALFGIYIRHIISLPNFGITMVANISFLGICILSVLILGMKQKFLLQSMKKLLK
jgi:hypothetical protein